MTDNHEPQAYPLNIRGDLSSPPNRGLWLIKWILAIPHFIVLIVLSIVGIRANSVIAFFAILFTARYPRGIFNFNVGCNALVVACVVLRRNTGHGPLPAVQPVV